jgi:hypothetical protein
MVCFRYVIVNTLYKGDTRMVMIIMMIMMTMMMMMIVAVLEISGGGASRIYF